MACGKAGSTRPLRRIPRSRSRTARLATPAVTAGSALASATFATVPGRPGRRKTNGPEVKEIGACHILKTGFLRGAKSHCELPEEADGAAWGAGDRQPRRLINDNWRR